MSSPFNHPAGRILTPRRRSCEQALQADPRTALIKTVSAETHRRLGMTLSEPVGEDFR